MQKNLLIRSRRMLLLLLIAITVASAASAQALMVASNKPKLDLQEKAKKSQRLLSDVLKKLEDHYKIFFVYNTQLLDGKKVNEPSDFPANPETLLNEILEEVGMKYEKIGGDNYAISDEEHKKSYRKKSELINESKTESIEGQSIKNLEKILQTKLRTILDPITGKVTDDKGEPLPGVSVVLKGTTNGTTTDANGQYTLNIPEQKGILVFTYIGMASEEMTIGTESVVNVQMLPDIATLSEVVVVGYGEKKKANYTGSVSTVNSKELVQAPVADISNALVGRLTGLIATQRTGEPGQDGSGLLIRGMGTIPTGDGTNVNPLIVVDGIPRDNFSQIDPNEIETVTLLKDAASAAVFGVRGANGVILVTTKRGKAGKTSLSFSARSDWQSPTRLPKYMNSYDYATLRNEGATNSGVPLPFTQDDLNKFKDGSDPNGHPNTDWIKETLKKYAPQQQYNLTLNGGTDKARYFISAGHVNQEGLFANSSYKRYNFRSNIDIDATKTTLVTINISGRSENRNAPGTNAGQILYSAIYNPPTYPAYLTNGLPGGYQGRQPAEMAKQGGYKKDVSNTLLTNFAITQQLPVKGLSVKGVLAYDRWFQTINTWNTPYTVYNWNSGTKQPVPTQGTGSSTINLREEFYQYGSLTTEAHINYDRTFGKHTISALAVYTQNIRTDKSIDGSRNNYVSSALDQLFAGSSDTQKITGGTTQSGRKGYVGRLNYSFSNKYFFEGNFRYDGSYNFNNGKRYGFFPSASVAWKISEEQFFRNALPAVDFLKIRASYGKLGNDRIPQYNYLSAYQVGSGYVFGSSPTQIIGLYSSGIADPNSTWEIAKSTNIGLEGSIWKEKLGFEIDYFYKRTDHILIDNTRSIPSTIGDNLPKQNIGVVDNKGFEMALTHSSKIDISSGIKYFLRGNMTYTKNKIVNIGEPANVTPAQRRTGRLINQFFGYKALGLFQSQAEIDAAPKQDNVKPGDIRYADINGRDSNGNLTGKPDGKIDGDDVTAIGKSNIPQLIYGLSGGISFKGFDVNFLFQGAGMVNAFVTGELAWPFYNGAKSLEIQKDHWTPSNAGAKFPRITDAPTNNNITTSSYWLKDASYVRLKNLEIGYNLPGIVTSKLKMANCRIFVVGQNLLTFDKLKVVDPEGPGDSGTGFNGNASRGWYYPQQKVYAIGVNVTF